MLAKDLYEQYGFVIYRTCLGILYSEDDAKDALQIVFVKLLENYDGITDKSRVVPWIFTTAKNHCFNLLRDTRKFSEWENLDEIPDTHNNDDQISNKDIIGRVLWEHNKDVQDAVYYTYIEEFDQQEIYKVTGQSPATIRRNLKRFNASLPSLRKRLGL